LKGIIWKEEERIIRTGQEEQNKEDGSVEQCKKQGEGT
jgi:hypothetical protein